jgi:hypothetical protein
MKYIIEECDAILSSHVWHSYQSFKVKAAAITIIVLITIEAAAAAKRLITI